MIVTSLGLGAVALLCASGHPLGLFAPTRLLLFGALFYVLPTLLTVAITGALVNIRLFDEAAIAVGGSLSLMGFGAAAFGSVIVEIVAPARSERGQSPVEPSQMVSAALTAGAVFAAGVGAVALFVFGIAGLGAIQNASYGERYQLMAGQGILVLGVRSAVVAMIVLYAIATALNHRRLIAATLLFGLGFQVWWMGLMGARSAFIQSIIGLLAVRQALGKRFSAPTMAAMALLLVAAGGVIGILRSGVGSIQGMPMAQVLAVANPANSEFGATLTTIGDVVAAVPSEESYRFGGTYVDAVALLVPRFLWDDRPQGASEWYVERFYPRVADEGGGFAFSPIAEAYLNFGTAGVVVVFFLIGLMFGVFDWLLRSPHGLSVPLTTVYGVSAVWVFLFSRLDSATLLKTVLLITIGQVVLIWLGGRAVHATARALGDVDTKQIP